MFLKLNSRYLSTITLAKDACCNITPSIEEKIPRKLYLQNHHPLFILKETVFDHFRQNDAFKSNIHDMPNPVVSVQNCFDLLLTPKDHETRSPLNTYYVNKDNVLRPHATAHQVELLQKTNSYLICGDVYRRDTIDATHYPVFHQIDGGKITKLEGNREKCINQTVDDLKLTLSGLVTKLFGNVKTHWVESVFPFTNPSFELEIWFNNKWLELLGCGVIQPKILELCGKKDYIGWAFGIGLERLAMPLFDIPDIRLFWSKDTRFSNQFMDIEPPVSPSNLPKFIPYSNYPPIMRDLSFWESPNQPFNENDLSVIIRNRAGDLCESIELVDHFVHPKTKKSSYCYRIMYRSMDRTLTNKEVNDIQEQVRNDASETLKITIR